jgi:hypothetical protein
MEYCANMQPNPLTAYARTFSVALLDEITNEMFGTKCENVIFRLKGSRERCDHGFKIHDSRNVYASEWFSTPQLCWSHF